MEKPNYEKALEYVNSGQYRWNAGRFIWSFITITNGLEAHQKEMAEACRRWQVALLALMGGLLGIAAPVRM